MTAPALITRGMIADAARTLYERLHHLDLQQAEEAIEDARKIVWVSQFSGSPASAAAALYARTPLAAVLAADLESRSLLEAEGILQELRIALYVNAYGLLEHTRFGALMRASVEAWEDEKAGRLRQ